MNLQQAKKIPIMYFFKDILGLKGRMSGSDILYCSPFRDDNKPSYSVSIEKNISYDFATGEARDIIGAIVDYYKISTSEALQKLENLTQKFIPKEAKRYIPKEEVKRVYIKQLKNSKKDDTQKVLTNVLQVRQKARILEIKELFSYPLKNYIKDVRKISLEIASIYLKEARYVFANDTVIYFGLIWQNISDGYEITRYSTIHKQSFKTAIGSKNVTFIQGFDIDINVILIFEGMFDFLSYLEHRKKPHLNEDVIILNSISCYKAATDLIKSKNKYKEVHLYLDNDEEGIKTTRKIKEILDMNLNSLTKTNRGTRNFTGGGVFKIGDIMSKMLGIMVVDKSELYKNFKDVNDWWININRE